MTDNFDDRNNENIMNQNNTSTQGSDCTSDINVQETPKAAEYVCNPADDAAKSAQSTYSSDYGAASGYSSYSRSTQQPQNPYGSYGGYGSCGSVGDNVSRSAQSDPSNHPGYAAGGYHGAHEYVYNAAPSPKKHSAGKTVLAIVGVILAVFVVSVVSISPFLIVTNGFETTGDSNPDVSSNNLIIGSDGTPQDLNSSADDGEDDDDAVAVDDNRTYPTLEQLAAPSDAMPLPEIYEKVLPSVVGVSCTLRTGTATGTGIIISEDGYIITNAHVVEDAISVMIVDNDMNEYEAEIIGSDTQTDIAVLKIDKTGLTPCEFGRSGDVKIGELAVVIGNPLGFELYGTMTDGIISGLNRTITIGDRTMTLIQTSASINQGNSGGPLINAYGQVIGITSAKVSSTYGENLGFAIPIDDAIPIIQDLIQYGYVTGRPLIGISGEDITPFMSLYYRLPEGVYVRFITPGSGAEAAGIQAGDIIIGLNGDTITTMSELTDEKNNFKAGDTVTLTIYRNGQSMDVDVVLGEVTSENEQ